MLSLSVRSPDGPPRKRGDIRVLLAITDCSIASIFDAFVTTKSHGMGLGLAICSTIIEQHGGKLTASSDGKSGALFQVSLPIEPTGQTPRPA
jgi:signal transduction histidine kinase